MFEAIIFIVVAFAAFGFWLYALVDAAGKAKNKVLWIVLIVLLGGLGALAWFIAGERESKKKISYSPIRRKTRAGVTGQRRGVRPGTGVARRPLRR